MTLRSAEFDDIYFSAEDGLAESRHVFLEGNDLPRAWAERSRFVIAETGFGTGLNFLAAWSLFAGTASAGHGLDYIAVEKYPLTAEQIGHALAGWAAVFGGRLDGLLANYPMRVPGFHRLVLDRQVSLTLIFDDVADALPQIVAPGRVDAWFLDGFAPAKNPQMWTPALFAQMARLSHAQTSYATFTAAGDVRRGLEQAGFTAERVKGYGRKRHMVRGRFVAGSTRPSSPEAPRKVAVVGGGLAGTATAFMLRREGIPATIFEAGEHLAVGASGNPSGLVNPRPSARRTAQSDYYSAAFATTTRLLGMLPGTGWRQCGSLHLATDDERVRKLRGAAAHWCWPLSHMQPVAATAASELAGLDLGYEALWLPDAGVVGPERLCRTLAEGGEFYPGLAVRPQISGGGWMVGDEFFEALVVAAGPMSQELLPGLPLRPVRGQITQIASPPPLDRLRCNLCYGGYIAPSENGIQWLGATFQRGETDAVLRPADDLQNLAKLAAMMGGLPESTVTGARAGIRAAAPDHFPIVGKIDVAAPLYVSAAHGSHGIVSSIAAAQWIVDIMMGRPHSLASATSAALSPGRFAVSGQ